MAILTNEQYRRLNEALVDAFPGDGDLTMMVRHGLGKNLAAIATGNNLNIVAFRLIEWAESRDQTLALVAAARNANPDNTALRRVAEGLRLAPESETLERIVLSGVAFQDVEKWRARMNRSELAVCRVEIPSGTGLGTGFLLGPDVAVTNYHVMVEVIENRMSSDAVRLRFDYKAAADGVAVQPGQEYRLAADWLIDTSPSGDLDYALLRVANSPGSQPVNEQNAAPARGWLTPEAHDFQPGEPLVILQHPSARPLMFANGSVVSIETSGKHLRYTANTERGSSGSPCFTNDWGLVALHHYGATANNRGVLFSAIVERLGEKGLLGVLGPAR